MWCRHQFLDRHQNQLSASKIDRYIKDVARDLSDKGLSFRQVAKTYSVEFELMKRTRFNASKIPGKYLLSLFRHHIRVVFSLGRTASLDSFTYRLAHDADLASLEWLADRVEALVAHDK